MKKTKQTSSKVKKGKKVAKKTEAAERRALKRRTNRAKSRLNHKDKTVARRRKHLTGSGLGLCEQAQGAKLESR